MRDISIPTRDGSFVLADVYLPLSPRGNHPVLISCTIYGRRIFYSGPDLEDQDEIVAFEKAEDEWHSTSTDVEIQVPRKSWGKSWASQRGFENIATFNTFTYVPRGYAMVKVDPRGVSQTPGTRNVPGQLSSDFFDAVEWATEQSWSNGSIALVGSSYGANTQWDVVTMKPKGLKCFVPYASDLDTYREAAYTGGIPAIKYLSDWYSRVQACSPKWSDKVDLVKLMNEHPFHDPAWLMTQKSMNHLDVPCFLAAPQIFMIHGRAAYEAWRVRSPENTHLQLIDCDYYSWPSKQAAKKILQFLDHHLKGNEYTKPEPVGIQVRVGYGKWYWRKEITWPVPGTNYIKWHLTADGKLATAQDQNSETSFAYSSKAPPKGKSGISFYSSPFDEDVDVVGHFSARLFVSSSTSDADFVVTLWAVDEKGHVVPLGSKHQPEPIAKGFLRASHRKTDEAKSLPERPWHTHTKADNAPLCPGEIVPIDVEIYPAAAKIRKGWKLRVDITPSEEQPDIEGYINPDMRITYGETHKEGTNRLHVGGKWVSYVACPVVPCKSDSNMEV
ncbi:Alpha/Beta hydrolase protein [Penicillium macrosclerotiorum]|uniref:Alpha/Beta hydrolase protein n=1 Tax=Penicillium macrosclerotiorum TaxID=303699 RepID=UPI0025486446|nr:Alpha/Beta hydrolase protein [Penicillium macrosclerotiorum]KAJ5669245.1 Alpha/Beta hydrolase protein [Penicillium macrosclerotiorum]